MKKRFTEEQIIGFSNEAASLVRFPMFGSSQGALIAIAYAVRHRESV